MPLHKLCVVTSFPVQHIRPISLLKLINNGFYPVIMQKMKQFTKQLLLGERRLCYIPLCAPSPVLAEFLGIMFKQTQLSCGCLARARLMGTGNTEAAQQLIKVGTQFA